MYGKYWLCFAVLLSACTLIDSGCNNGANPDSSKNNLDTDTTGMQIIMTTSDYMFNCCGIFSSVQFHPKQTGYIQFQAWRPLVTNVYMLVGEFRYYVPKKDETYTVPISDEIVVHDGDMMGWYSEGEEIVPYKSGASETNDIIMLNASLDFTVNYNHSVTSNFIHGRTYAYHGYVTDSSVPYFNNLPETIQVYDHVVSGTQLYSVDYTDDNANDRASLTLSLYRLTPNSANVVFDTTTGSVTTSGTLNKGNIELIARVRDQCGKEKTAKLKIEVINYAPVIANLPASIDLPEITTNETWLQNISVSDASGDDITCSIASTSPNNAPFLVKFISGTNTYAVYSKVLPKFDYDSTTEYDISVECTDTKDSDTEVFKVYLIRNEEPVFTNLPTSITISTDTSVGTIVFTASATDPENDTLRYSIHSCGGGCSFEMAENGDLMVKTSLLGTTYYSMDIYIRVSDGVTQISSKTLTIILTDVNNGPVLKNLPFNLILREDVAVGSEVFSLLVWEPDTDDTLQYQVSYNPLSTGNVFTFNENTKQITLSETLDYESGVTSYEMSFTVSDTKTTDGPKKLSITVINVNEAPVFQKDKYYITNIERPKTYSLTSPSFTVSDNDINDTVEYSFIGGDDSSRFLMDTSTGDLKFAVTYDVDNNLMPSFMTFIVQAKDAGGMTGTTVLEVSITDGWNDNYPDFPEVAYEFSVECDISIVSTISYVTANDPDDGINGYVIYEILTGDHSSYFGIGVDSGELYVALPLTDFCNYTLLTFQLQASNGASYKVTVSVFVMVTPATEDPGMFDNAWTVAWFSILMIMGAVVLLLIVIAFYRLCRYGYIFTFDSISERFRNYLAKRKERAEAKKAEAKKKKAKVIEIEPLKKRPSMAVQENPKKSVTTKTQEKKPGIIARFLNTLANINLFNNLKTSKVGNTNKKLNTTKKLTKAKQGKTPKNLTNKNSWSAWSTKTEWVDDL